MPRPRRWAGLSERLLASGHDSRSDATHEHADSGPTGKLAEFISTLELGAIPETAQRHTLNILIDAVACALVADRSEETQQVNAFARGLAPDGASTVVGDRRTTSRTAAVILNGFRITAVTACDVYAPAHFHVSPEVVPPALAIAEQQQATGADLHVALAAGLETATRVARGLNYPAFRDKGWHTPGVVGPFGGAAAVASMLSLDWTKTRNALALAGSQSAGTWAAWGTPTVKFHQARGALSGMLAGLLAAEGFRGSDEILTHPDGGIYTTYSEGADGAQVTAGLGSRWELAEVSLRKWPGGTPLQPIMTALFRALDERPAAPDEIERLVLSVPALVHRAHDRFFMPSGTFDALLSIRYAASVIVHDNEAWLSQFARERYMDPVLHKFIGRVDLEADESLPRDGGAVTIVRHDGTRQTVRVNAPRGDPKDPLSAAEVERKFLRCAEGCLEPSAAEELLERLNALPAADDLAPIFALLRGGDQAHLGVRPSLSA